MDSMPGESNRIDSRELREILLEVAETLEAVIIALQAERTGAEPGYVIREAVRRVVLLRQHLDAPGGEAI
ncbi:MAG: hypothetical protein IPF51_10335 [Dehalococcoidia bacterium]|uniref:hypothetical protein n=1 Tax=Candidatus Amarobacter glycogenicus TaxID=3140699 RepID=UPI0031372C6A|nr:hypothetical protein [Dehalococcoidia bacterium]